MILKDLMDWVILSRLRNVPSSGYDVIIYIHQKKNLHISAGIIYSTLYSLERRGLVMGKFAVNKRVYRITQDGLDYIESILNNRDQILKFVDEILE